MKRLCVLLLLAASPASFVSEAYGTTITQSNESVIYSPTWGLGGITVSSSFNKFDQGLGSLDSVSLVLSGQIQYLGSFRLTPSCLPPTSCWSDYSFSTGVSFNAPSYPLTDPNSNPFYINAGWRGHVSSPDLQSVSKTVLIKTNQVAGNLEPYIGQDSVVVTDGVSEDSDSCIQHGVDCGLSANIDLWTSLVYDYTPIKPVQRFASLQAPIQAVPVPEPMSIFVMSTGLLGLISFKRRRKCCTTE